ncbi:MAG: glycoside hydrolase family 15 protein [Acidobacteria bacterium]|nr:glycoside hydrolase family 15 protein [Acidobacteriota bacterium]
MRDIPVGNGSLLVTFDEQYQIRDVYFPHVGQENHTEGFPFHFGVWVDGVFSWIADDGWDRTLKYLPETLVTNVTLNNKELGIEILCNDTVLSHENVYLRKVAITNLRDETREVRTFLHQDFRIYENKVGDTAFYDPESLSLIHYKKHRYFLINSDPHFDFFSTGRKAFRDQEGTWRDAEDGLLHGGAITEGSVDSTIQINSSIGPKGKDEFFYWIAAGTSHEEVCELNQKILTKTPQYCLNDTATYSRLWVNKYDKDFDGLSPEVIELYKRSLLIIRTQFDNGGAILAANDSDVTLRATDHYSYLWTRDGAFIANALDLAGYPHFTREFFNLCARIVHPDGYFLQKYNADGTVASGWHAAWDVWAKKKLLPIQEDETSLVLWALWEHYDKYREVEFARKVYHPLITKCADFLLDFRDEKTGLPRPSWNLWEDRRGVHTFTCSTVVAGLRAAAKFASIFGEADREAKYLEGADQISEAMRDHLYSTEHGRFLRALNSHDDENFDADPTIDASLFGIFYFGVFSADDELVLNTMRAIERELWVAGDIGGIARFEDDGYMRVSDDHTGNAWFLCTLWLADHRIALARSKDDLKGAIEILEWTSKNAIDSGVLAEQLNPIDGSPVSVSPLTWSHSTFVATVENYLIKLEELGRSEAQ